MSIDFPPEIESFVEHEVSAGTYASREELIVAAPGRRYDGRYSTPQASARV
jgi:hypothetical protein